MLSDEIQTMTELFSKSDKMLLDPPNDIVAFYVSHRGDLTSTDIIRFVSKQLRKKGIWHKVQFAVTNDRKYRIDPIEVEFWFVDVMSQEQYDAIKKVLPSTDITKIFAIRA